MGGTRFRVLTRGLVVGGVFTHAKVAKDAKPRQEHGGGKSRKGKGWAEPKPKKHIIDKCKIIRIVSHNE